MADNPEAQQTSQSTSSGWRNYCHVGIFRSPFGLLKLAEFVLILLALILVSSVSATGVGAIDFFIFVATFAWALTTLHIILLLLNLYNKLPVIMRTYLIHTGCCAGGTVAFLLCSSILLGKYKYHSTLAAGGVFGLICMGLFALETVWFFIKFRNEGNVTGDGGGESAPPKNRDDFAEPGQPGY